MKDRITTEKIKGKVLGMGMDLVGFAPVERWKHAPYLLSPQAILPESKTVVVGAIHITDTWVEMGGEPEPQDHSPGGWMDQNSLMDRVAYHVVRLLEEYGYKAIAIASSNIWRYRAFEGIPSFFAPDLSHIHAATAAGLAEIGWSGLAITPEFGSRCRFISIVTDAELEPTPMYDGPKLCDMCMECVKYCPTAALKKELLKPHEVKIGGKTYKYANKNIWRCAWAEHFNLNLNSENLKKWEKISEKEILRELNTNGIRGHERGVCQKVCVPPHLRTKRPSFGRNRQIAQNRINQRYPDSMPTLRKIRDDLISQAIKQGIDLVSVGSLDLENSATIQAQKEAPGVRTVIGLVMQIPPEALSNKWGHEVTGPFTFAWNRKMHHVLLRLARMIEDCGYHAASYTGDWGPGKELTTQLAEMSGIGNFNKKSKFVVPEFGHNIIVGAITTDALIDPTPSLRAPYEYKRKKKVTGEKLRRKLENIAEENLVSFMGIADAKLLEKTAGELKSLIPEKELGEYVKDTARVPYNKWKTEKGGKKKKNDITEHLGPACHGVWKSEIGNEHRKIRSPQDYVKGAKSVIVLGMHFPSELIANSGLEKSKQIGTYAFHQYQTCFELRFAANELVKFLSNQGYKVIITEDMFGIGSYVDSPRGLLPDARCNAIEAVAAGLGEIGKSGALLTEEYGPHQRRIVIVTDAEIPTDKPYCGKKICKECNTCAEQCSMSALNGEFHTVSLNGSKIKIPKIDRHRCDWSKRYSLCPEEGPVLIGNDTKVAVPNGKITINHIAKACNKKDPIMKNRTCILESCLRHCPAGNEC